MGKPVFFFASCRAGSELVLKREVAARQGRRLTPAFMRPQLITWKAADDLPDSFEFQAAFAAVCGRSLGIARSIQEVLERLSESSLSFSAIHVFPRLIAEDGLSQETWHQMESLRAELTASCPLQPESPHVLDLIVGESTEPWFVGTHRLGPNAHPFPGALPPLQLPDDAPSRAWLKMEQSLAWLGLNAPGRLNGKAALELGSAPGGASWSLLQRGARVIGVDTGEMDPRVANHPHYDHISLAAGDVPFDYLPEKVDVLASDMNLSPDTSLRYIEPMCRHLRPDCLILTLKMNHAGIEAQLPSLVQRIQAFAPGPVHVKQLHANRREVTAVSGGLA